MSIIIFNIDLFTHTKRKKWGKKLGLFMGFFWGVIVNIHNNKVVHDAYIKLMEKIHSNLHKYKIV
jgi:hypothetical protein